jgi:Cu/Zn superoxide dismutase
MSRIARRALLGAGALMIAVAAVVAASAGSAGTKTVSAATVTVHHAKPVGGVRTIRFKKGRPINLTVRSDTADEVHFHGYDVGKDVAKGGAVTFRMPATIEGKFEVELEHRKQQLAEVEVLP